MIHGSPVVETRFANPNPKTIVFALSTRILSVN